VYLAATHRLGVDPVDAAAVEDSTNGLRAAAAAGMVVIASPNPISTPRRDARLRCARSFAGGAAIRADSDDAAEHGSARDSHYALLRRSISST
jgi:beta-phosphoglucomutase-like phosphatase (HAD superfamily)